MNFLVSVGMYPAVQLILLSFIFTSFFRHCISCEIHLFYIQFLCAILLINKVTFFYYEESVLSRKLFQGISFSCRRHFFLFLYSFYLSFLFFFVTQLWKATRKKIQILWLFFICFSCVIVYATATGCLKT